MKKLLFIAVLAFGVVGFLSWFWKSKPSSRNNLTKTSQSQSGASVIPTGVFAQTGGKTKVQQAGGAYEPGDPRWKWWKEMNKKDPQFEWKMPIKFYGKVVEYTTGHPLSGVEVTLVWNDLSKEGTSRAVIYSDAQGLFKLTGEFGKILSVSRLKKEGYVRSRYGTRSTFEYAAFFEQNYHQPDQNNLVIFRMKKKGVAEPLIHRDVLYGLKPDGTPHYLDLKTGRKSVGGVPTGDLVLRLTRTPADHMNHPDWKLIIQGIGRTRILESSEEFMFEAPLKGYINQVQVEQSGEALNYQSQIYKNYYIKLADGTFARIETHIFSKYNDEAAINIVLYLNPARGNRNLEYDPAKKVNK